MAQLNKRRVRIAARGGAGPFYHSQRGTPEAPARASREALVRLGSEAAARSTVRKMFDRIHRPGSDRARRARAA